MRSLCAIVLLCLSGLVAYSIPIDEAPALETAITTEGRCNHPVLIETLPAEAAPYLDPAMKLACDWDCDPSGEDIIHVYLNSDGCEYWSCCDIEAYYEGLCNETASCIVSGTVECYKAAWNPGLCGGTGPSQDWFVFVEWTTVDDYCGVNESLSDCYRIGRWQETCPLGGLGDVNDCCDEEDFEYNDCNGCDG